MNLNQVTIPSLNVEKAVGFYETLGLNLIVKTHSNYARFECTEGNSTFSIHKVNKMPSGEGIIVYFECENLDKTVETLLEKGLIFDELPNDKTWLWREAHLKDYDGNKIILYYAGNNRLNPPWKLNT